MRSFGYLILVRDSNDLNSVSSIADVIIFGQILGILKVELT